MPDRFGSNESPYDALRAATLGSVSRADSNNDLLYLRLDATNDPVTGALDIQTDSATALRVLDSGNGARLTVDTLNAYNTLADNQFRHTDINGNGLIRSIGFDGAGRIREFTSPINANQSANISLNPTNSGWLGVGSHIELRDIVGAASKVLELRMGTTGAKIASWSDDAITDPRPIEVAIGPNTASLPIIAQFQNTALDSAVFVAQGKQYTGVRINGTTHGQLILAANSIDQWSIYSQSDHLLRFYKFDGTPGDAMSLTNAGVLTTSRFISTIAPGTAPLDVSSTTLVTNLNADLLDGLHASAFPNVGAASAQYQYITTGAGPTYTPAWSGGYLNIASGKTLTVNDSMISAGQNFANTFTADQTISGANLTIAIQNNDAIKFLTSHANAPYNFFSDKYTFNGTVDDRVWLAFNINPVNSQRLDNTLHAIGQLIESDYNDGSKHLAEWNFNYISAAGTQYRYQNFVVNLADSKGYWAWWGGVPSGDGSLVINSSGKVGVNSVGDTTNSLLVEGDAKFNNGVYKFLSTSRYLYQMIGTNSAATSVQISNSYNAGSPSYYDIGFYIEAFPGAPGYGSLQVGDAGGQRVISLNPSGGGIGLGTTSVASVVKVELRNDNTPYTTWNNSQLRIAGASDPNKFLSVGYDTTTDVGVIQAANAAYDFTALYLNKMGAGVSSPVIIGSGTSSGHKLQVYGDTFLSGALSGAYTTTAIDLTLTTEHHWITVTATGKTITLPAAATCTGREYIISATAANVIVDGNGSETINGYTTYTMSADSTMQIKSNGSGWIII